MDTLENPADKAHLPALLVSYVYLEEFLRKRSTYHYRDWVLDSGAFSVFTSGATIRVEDYTDKCLELLAGHDPPTEIFALDVIGDWKASLANTEFMWKAGVPAIPAYHLGEPEHALLAIAKDYPKIAIGGIAQLRGKAKSDVAAQCISRVWPKKVHGFGIGQEKLMLKFPWHSVDATSWELGPARFGNWHTYGQMSVRGSKQDLRCEIAWYLDLEKKARAKWRKEMVELEALEPSPTVRRAVSGYGDGKHGSRLLSLVDSDTARLEPSPTVRLATNSNDRADRVLTMAPTVRLVAQGHASSRQKVSEEL
jgi:hypothetical protein